MLLKLMKKNAATELDQEDQDKVALLLETQKFDHEIERICEHDKKRELWAWKTSQKPEDSLIPVLKKILTEYSRRAAAPSVQPSVPRMQLANHRSVSVADDSVVIDEQDEMEGFDDLEAPEAVNNKGVRAAEKKNRKKQRAAAKAAALAAAGISISGAALQEEAVRAAQVYYNS